MTLNIMALSIMTLSTITLRIRERSIANLADITIRKRIHVLTVIFLSVSSIMKLSVRVLSIMNFAIVKVSLY